MKVKKLKIGWLHKCDYCTTDFIGRANRKYCCTSCNTSNNNSNKHAVGELNPNWRGGKRKNYKKEHPDRIHANNTILELRRKNMIKPGICTSCRKLSAKNVAHHPDYSKPLLVLWLCPTCHTNLHFIIRRLKELKHAM